MPIIRLTGAISYDTEVARAGVALVLTHPAAEGRVRLLLPSGLWPEATVTWLDTAAAALRAKGGVEEIVRVPMSGADAPADLVLLVGIGDPDTGVSDESSTWRADVLRRAAGAAARALPDGSDAVVLVPEELADSAAAVGAIAEGLSLGGYTFTRFRSTSADAARPDGEATSVAMVVPADAATHVEAALERAEIVAAAVTRARDLVNTPPNALTPADLADVAAALAHEFGLEVEVLDEAALRSGGYGGITAVGQGSVNPPRLVRLTWRPAGAVTTVSLIGKGITFDTGGISLKPPASMTTMKSDMSGAAAVLAAIVALARLGVSAEVTGWLALAENMPSGTAQRPSDVITMYGGKTVEVLNTDAEGRLVLGDAIARSCEDSPDRLVVVATLTGAQGVALGVRTSGVMGDPAVRGEVVDAADRAGDAMWPMPLPDDVRSGMDSDVADIANIGDAMGGMLAGGLFLREFVAPGTAWAHLDIARPAYNEKGPWGFTTKGATGVPVRTLIEYVSGLAADGDATTN